jgi:YfiH family protein
MIQSKTLNIIEKNGVCYITFPKLMAAGGNLHAFSTRIGGVSQGHCSSMSFGFSVGDKEESVFENFRIFCNAVGFDSGKLVLSQQTHTANIRCVTEDDIGKGVWRERDYSDIDGLVTNVPDIVLVTQYADCTPLVLFDPVTKTAATSHAGWRGTVGEIALKTVEVMVKAYGANPENIVAAIGPNIAKCCYEVDNPVIDEINRISYLNRAKCYTEKENGKFMLDLREVNREILIHAGVKEENIDVADLCTCCNSDVFHSHRASKGKRGTLAAMICVK